MILTTNQILSTISVIALVTLLTRALPFLLFPNNKKTPQYIIYLGNVLPYAIIGMLVIYCLKNVSFLSSSHGLPEFISIIFIIIIQLWKRNILFSIGGGTILYMLLVQVIFK